MRALIVLALLAAPASSAAEAAPAPSVRAFEKSPLVRPQLDCFAGRVEHANKGERLQPRRLDELPPGKLYHSVMRQFDGCQEMVLVSQERGRFRR